MTFHSSLDTEEIVRFSERPQNWWDPDGAWSPLHKLNPVRVAYIRRTLLKHFGRSDGGKAPLKGLSVLDLGCGGGLLCEPLARWGARVIGLDASEQTLEAARTHALREGLSINYRNMTIEAFSQEKRKPSVDAVLALEVLEHAGNVDSLLHHAASVLKPGGVIILSTVNRTQKSFLLGIVAAEYLLGWVPPGMHDWDKFIKPSELAAHLHQAGLVLSDLAGMVYNPFKDGFSLHPHKLDVNYLATAVKE
ncbi:MAG: bifunctional 2-polyprenyl-6-hydroxyphenol methylase/3-demethylubiquinol 3-O-methyltransferase UbiG [Alphaproteobacteria bacterium]|nr:bifunctional 2-polyprenyl-6-hydroxyphenol methylase/3-demethylubiquinol 3-O-methyltransferase UbiG [Alphaproteobacteria bacterium]